MRLRKNKPTPVSDKTLRIGGADRVLRTSILYSAIAHVLVILLPVLIGRGACRSDAYLIPGGGGGGGAGGQPKVEVVKIVKQKTPNKRKRIIARPNSAISFRFPSIDDSAVVEEVEEETLNTYVADTTKVDELSDAIAFGYGQGPGDGSIGSGGGKGGGFAGGVVGGVVRFIRLEHDAAQWDDGMDAASRADGNFLDEFHRVSKFKVADSGESIPIVGLRHFKPGRAPPFVYMTGNGPIGSVSSGEIKTLQEYLQNGGMIFADAGSDSWDRSFRALLGQIFPDKQLVDIANDDPIYRYPFYFPDGAPPLWHHGGSRALGVKHEGRWCVFYHPGDMNDAWKTGHSGAKPSTAQASMKLGINVAVYAFMNYIDVIKSNGK